jgi:hypothetical protein
VSCGRQEEGAVEVFSRGFERPSAFGFPSACITVLRIAVLRITVIRITVIRITVLRITVASFVRPNEGSRCGEDQWNRE